jgi:ribosomal-protein-alanine N-acetyltransferase
MGKALMEACERLARDRKASTIMLEVRPSNEVARNMYDDLGYIETGSRKNYYSDNQEDALLMVRFLI